MSITGGTMFYAQKGDEATYLKFEDILDRFKLFLIPVYHQFPSADSLHSN